MGAGTPVAGSTQPRLAPLHLVRTSRARAGGARGAARLALRGGRDGAVDAQKGHAAGGQRGGDDVQHDARLAEQQRAVARGHQPLQQLPDELGLARGGRACGARW